MSNKVEDKTKDDRLQGVTKCRVRIYKINNMQRCPYIHEMKERLLGEQIPLEVVPPGAGGKKIATPTPPPQFVMDPSHHQPQHQTVATVVKLNPDGYSSHTSPTRRADRTPLMPKEPEDEFHYVHQKVYPKNAKTSLFIIMSFVYAKLLVVVCIAYVISDVVTHNIPLYYYEGFFTYLYGVSILFLLYVFCFLLQESACCSGAPEKPPPVKPSGKQKAREKEKEKEIEKERKKEEEKKKKEEKERLKKEKKEKEKEKDKKNKKQDKREMFPRKKRDLVLQQQHQAQGASPLRARDQSEEPDQPISLQWQFEAEPQQQQGGPAPPPAPPQAPPPSAPPTNNSAPSQGGAAAVDVEQGVQLQQVVRTKCKRKTSQNDHSHGSFFLRIGAIAFGLGTMIYNGLEFGVFFEVPLTSPCYMILRGINPVLQMIFTFMQMYFIFMNSRLNIHRFKVIARFGLMHVVATNVCVWIRTLVIEYLKEITNYHLRMFNSTLPSTVSPFAESIRLHNLRNSKTVLGSHRPYPDPGPSFPVAYPTFTSPTTSTTPSTTTMSFFRDFFRTTTTTAATTVTTAATTTLRSTTSNPYVFTSSRPYHHHYSTPGWRMFNMMPTVGPTPATTTTTTTTTTTPFTTTLRTTAAKVWSAFTTAATTSTSTTTSTTTTTSSPLRSYLDYRSFPNDMASAVVSQEPELSNAISRNGSELLNDIIPEAFRFSFATYNSSLNGTDKCGRVNIMGTIVQDSSPYLYPFIIEYSLIGAAVIYVMWKHIGRNPRYVTPEDLEHRLEIMLSRRAVALAQVQQGRVDCVGASKGLFFGLLMLVGSLICLILFFVLVHHKDFGLLAIYLADVSHCALMVLSIIAIIIGFFRVQSLKFKTEEQSDLNDILLRVSAFGLFLYAVFSVIAGHLNAFTREPNLLVMITGALSVLQVILQLLFIADVSRRRVHLPEHDRSKPGRQVVTFLLICNVTMWIIYTFEMQKVEANPVQLEFYGFLAWAIVQRFTLPLCIFHRFHSAVTLAEIWKTSYKARLE